MSLYVRRAVLLLAILQLLSVKAFALDFSIKENWRNNAYKTMDSGLEFGVLPITESLLPKKSPLQPLSTADEMEELRASLSEYLVMYVYMLNSSSNVKAYLYPTFNAVCVEGTGEQRMTALWESSASKKAYLQMLAELFTRNPATDDNGILLALFDGLSNGYSYRLKENYPLLAESFESINGVIFPRAFKDGLMFFPRPGQGSHELRLYLPNIRLQESGIPGYKLYDFIFSIPNPEYRQEQAGH
ncbi:MAG: hypothetical protein PHD91_01400 [bacterium]|jgi:hypothetical protein|nr:hypothetical protein [bacterium]MDD4152359.1 hypothetical protein [bacterium]